MNIQNGSTVADTQWMSCWSAHMFWQYRRDGISWARVLIFEIQLRNNYRRAKSTHRSTHIAREEEEEEKTTTHRHSHICVRWVSKRESTHKYNHVHVTWHDIIDRHYQNSHINYKFHCNCSDFHIDKSFVCADWLIVIISPFPFSTNIHRSNRIKNGSGKNFSILKSVCFKNLYLTKSNIFFCPYFLHINTYKSSTYILELGTTSVFIKVYAELWFTFASWR